MDVGDEQELQRLSISVAVIERRLTTVEATQGDLRLTQASNHTENRGSIHALRNGQQAIIDSIHELHLQFVNAKGYVLGAVAATGVLTTGIVILIQHLWK